MTCKSLNQGAFITFNGAQLRESKKCGWLIWAEKNGVRWSEGHKVKKVLLTRLDALWCRQILGKHFSPGLGNFLWTCFLEIHAWQILIPNSPEFSIKNHSQIRAAHPTCHLHQGYVTKCRCHQAPGLIQLWWGVRPLQTSDPTPVQRLIHWTAPQPISHSRHSEKSPLLMSGMNENKNNERASLLGVGNEKIKLRPYTFH